MIDQIPPSKVYSCLWKCRDLEINMLWTRLTLVGTFMALTYAGYGALVLKGLEGIKSWEAFNLVAVGASAFGLLFSILWTTTAKGSKAWFERYEAMLSHFQETYKDLGLFTRMADEEQVLSYLDYNKKFIVKRTRPVDINLFSQSAGAYSVSKIPIVMGQLSIVGWLCIGLTHVVALSLGKVEVWALLQMKSVSFACALIVIVTIVAVFVCFRVFSSALMKRW